MTIGDLLDNVASAADDSSTTFRANALRWLNLVRAHTAERARWRGAVRVDTFPTVATQTDGLYTLFRYEHLAEDVLYDETNKQTILHESNGTLNSIDVAKETTGQPSWWSDAGQDGLGNRKIYLWPIPDGAFTVRFTGVANLVDIESTEEDLEVDPYFGKIVTWGDCFAAGLRYYHLDDSDEDAQQTLTQLRIFDRLIDAKRQVNRVAPVASIQLANVRQSFYRRRRAGRFDPAHFENR